MEFAIFEFETTIMFLRLIVALQERSKHLENIAQNIQNELSQEFLAELELYEQPVTRQCGAKRAADPGEL